MVRISREGAQLVDQFRTLSSKGSVFPLPTILNGVYVSRQENGSGFVPRECIDHKDKKEQDADEPPGGKSSNHLMLSD